MGFQRDQSFTGETYRPISHTSNAPPPLPPRHASYSFAPPSYEAAMSGYHSQSLTKSWSAQDPRSSSTDSLVPRENRGKRTLLLIFIHGFLGNESSFQSFPAHIHNLTTSMLSETHVVHTKIYPRYKSRKAIEYARDDFSNWLCPHESPQTDVLLLGHSMGGILGAEVALLTPYSSTSRDRFRHRILGTVNFDTPFLGMHPGVIASGIGSLFRPAPKSKERQQETRNVDESQPLSSSSRHRAGSSENSPLVRPALGGQSNSSAYFNSTSEMATLDSNISPQASQMDFISPLGTPVNDPNFDPPFQNDVRIPTRKGWDNTLHFIMKHSEGLTQATKSYVMSHLEFGGCLADYPALKNRYAKIRALEDVNELLNAVGSVSLPFKRVRFVNYYTASTGRIREDKRLPNVRTTDYQPQLETDNTGMSGEMQNVSLAPTDVESLSNITKESSSLSQGIDNAISSTPSVSVQNLSIEYPLDEEALSYTNQEMRDVEPGPLTDESGSDNKGLADAETTTVPESASNRLSSEQDDTTRRALNLQLPPVPPAPVEPLPFDPSPYTNKEERKVAEREHSRQMKAFQRAVKDRDKTIKERRKLVEKREKDDRQARGKRLKEEKRLRVKDEKDAIKQQIKSNESNTPSTTGQNSGELPLTQKAKRDKKFCMLPPAFSNGERDPCWLRVFMEGVDEVGAHCGLFFAENPHYEALVKDVGERIERWVREAGSKGTAS